ncbi:MAG: sulfite exporter TauE/SafE family protein [Candidatus Dormibacteria bacterium]
MVTFSLLALPLGLLIGVSLGALGGGGSILTVPALVYVIGENPRNATSASLVIVGVTAFTGTIAYARSRRVRWGPGLVFGVVGVGGSLLGSELNRLVNPNALLLAFAGLMVLAAGAMLQRSAQATSVQPSAPRAIGDRLTAKRLVGAAAAGTVVGFMTGFFGVGGGFVVVPGLVLALGFGMPEAVGTSLLVIALNSMVALAARGGVTALDWHVVIPFTAAAMAGSVVGGGLAARVRASALERSFAGLLVLISVYTATRSILGLV